jgi:hypothetical protein
LATAVGIASVAVAVLTYTISMLPQLRRVVAWNDSVHVLSLDDLSFTIANEGDGIVHVSHAAITWIDPTTGLRGAMTLPVGRTLEPGAIQSGEIDRGQPEGFRHGLVVAYVSDQEWADPYRSSGSIGETQKYCVYRHFYSTNHPYFVMFSGILADDLRTLSTEATLHYYSLHTRSMNSTKVDCVGVLEMNERVTCEKER